MSLETSSGFLLTVIKSAEERMLQCKRNPLVPDFKLVASLAHAHFGCSPYTETIWLPAFRNGIWFPSLQKLADLITWDLRFQVSLVK